MAWRIKAFARRLQSGREVIAIAVWAIALLLVTPAAPAQVAVEVAGLGAFVPFEVGTPVYGPTDRYTWYTIPSVLTAQPLSFWQIGGVGFPSIDYGITTFEVQESGPVWMVTSTRFGGGGNSSGGWLEQVTTRAELESQGWSEITSGLWDYDQALGQPGLEYVVFERPSLAGESFTYRTEKYLPPILLSPLVTPSLTSFVIDPAQSFVNFEAMVAGGIPFEEQAPGSLQIRFEGTILAELDAGESIRFHPGSELIALEQPGPFAPTGGPANIAAQLSLLGQPFVLGSVSDVVLSIQSALLAIDEFGAFDPQLNVTFTSATFDYQYGTAAPETESLVGFGAVNESMVLGQLEHMGDVLKLTIPFEAVDVWQIDDLGIEMDVRFSGQIVAYTAAPEPSTLLLGVLGAAAFAWIAARQSRRRRR